MCNTRPLLGTAVLNKARSPNLHHAHMDVSGLLSCVRVASAYRPPCVRMLKSQNRKTASGASGPSACFTSRHASVTPRRNSPHTAKRVKTPGRSRRITLCGAKITILRRVVKRPSETPISGRTPDASGRTPWDSGESVADNTRIVCEPTVVVKSDAPPTSTGGWGLGSRLHFGYRQGGITGDGHPDPAVYGRFGQNLWN